MLCPKDSSSFKSGVTLNAVTGLTSGLMSCLDGYKLRY